MLNQAPTAVNALTRNVIVNHPNSYTVAVLRKAILRKDDGKLGGKPTIGGMGELDSDDEENIEWLRTSRRAFPGRSARGSQRCNLAD